MHASAILERTIAVTMLISSVVPTNMPGRDEVEGAVAVHIFHNLL